MMKKRFPRGVSPALLAAITLAACRSTTPAAEPATSPPARTTADVRPRHTAADVQFMQAMIGHHAQALVMTALVPTRTSRADLRLLAERIEVSQRDEIRLMQDWLRRRGEEAPGPGAQHGHHGAAGPQTMPGMLTTEELAQLEKATGADFDRRFLQYMIRHHEGALTMVTRLFGTNGAAQESDTYRFATDVEADQRAEIARMRALLATLNAR